MAIEYQLVGGNAYLPQSATQYIQPITITTAGTGPIIPSISWNSQSVSQTGQLTTVAFMDAMGQTWALTIDATCATAMHAISNLHQSKLATVPNIYPDPIIVTPELGEFSLDEIEKAEKIIEELENG